MNTKKDIKFPVSWTYKIIVLAGIPGAKDDICQVLQKNGVDNIPEKGNTSKKGKYVTYNVDVIFKSKQEMDKISAELSALECVKFLL